MRAASLAETTPFQRADAFGPYLVYEKLGEGGMAVVHRAEHVGETGLRKPVALKRLHTESSEDPSLVASFVREAQLAGRLRHPNIAQAYDLGRIDGTYFIAMELVSGPTLAQVLTMTRNGAGAVPLSIALEILIELADALEHVHGMRDEAGNPLELVHRDVSPMNIVISRTGAAKLIDFGIAKVRSARPSTEAGIIKGKHAYIAPEYTHGHLDQRSDLFGLGVVAHELLTGRRLFAADSELATIRNVRELPVPPPSRLRPGISRELDAIVLRAVEREPGMRWQTASDLRNALVTEARRLGKPASGPQIRDWVAWAFQQVPRRVSSVDRMLEACEPSISIEIVEMPPSRASEPAIAAAEVALAETEPALVVVDELPDLAATTPAPKVDLSAATIEVRRPTAPTVVEVPQRAPTAPTVVEVPQRRASTPRPAGLEVPQRRAPTPPAARELPLPAPPVVTEPIAEVSRPRRRLPAWRPPTRWMKPAPTRSAAPFLLLALIAFAALAIDQHWIDLERWRQIIDAMV
jgi:serine/threonine protein kinase